MKTINKTNDKIVFSAEIEESLANAVRRYINQIPILAVDELEISKNDSVLYDETVAHRIGLIPLRAKKAITEKTTAELKLDVKKEGMVYSGELQGDVEVVYDKMPITLLTKGQELSVVATVKAGKGSEHAKFSPGLMFYRNIVNLKIDKDCPKEVVEACPEKILKSEGGKIIVDDNQKCDMCEACVEVCQKHGKESIKFSPTQELLITVESFGQMEVKNIFKKALEILEKDLEEISSKL
jgi:DNA-directed RNA polymerase subunit D